MKNFIFLLSSWLLLAGANVSAQQAITSAGAAFTNNQNSVSWGLGELAIETLILDDYILTQGFQQPLISVTAISETPRIDVNVNVYPNPINNFVKIDVTGANYADFEYLLFGQKGDAIEQKKFESESLEVSFQHLDAGVYFIKVMDTKQYSKTFKVVKN